jgi:hypothetical protein
LVAPVVGIVRRKTNAWMIAVMPVLYGRKCVRTLAGREAHPWLLSRTLFGPLETPSPLAYSSASFTKRYAWSRYVNQRTREARQCRRIHKPPAPLPLLARAAFSECFVSEIRGSYLRDI